MAYRIAATASLNNIRFCREKDAQHIASLLRELVEKGLVEGGQIRVKVVDADAGPYWAADRFVTVPRK